MPQEPQPDNSSTQELKRWRSLRWRMRFLFQLSGLTLLALLLIGSSVYYIVSNFEERAWLGRQQEAATNAAETVANFIYRVEDFLTLFSTLNPDYLLNQPDIITTLIEQAPALLEVIRLNKEGEVIATAYRDVPLLDNIFTIPQSQWYLQAKAGQNYVSDVRITAGSQPHIIISVPAPDGGVIAARIHMELLWDLIAAIRFGQTGEAYVINQDGQIVAHANPEIALANTNISNRPEFQALSTAPDKQWYGFFIDFQEKPVFGVTAPVEGTAWIVMTELSENEANAVSQQTLLFNAGILLLGAAVLVGTAYFVGRSIYAPMEVLRSSVERIGLGDLNARVEIDRSDEIGQVAAAFNEMTHNLQEREEQLILARDRAFRLYADLKNNEQKYRTLFEDSHDVIFIANSGGRFVDINPAGLKLFGYDYTEITEMYIIELHVNLDDHVKFQQLIKQTGSIKDFETTFLTKGNIEKPCLITAVLRYDKQGNLTGYQGIIRDITTQKRAEEQRLQLSILQRELLIAHDIQDSLLPPVKPDWAYPTVICYSIPARDVGGDFYKYHKFDGLRIGDTSINKDNQTNSQPPTHNRYAFAIGDVSGKGVSAALLMATSLSQFDASLGQHFSPIERLRYLDQVISPYTKPRRQNCALCYAELEIRGNVAQPVLSKASPEGSNPYALLHIVNAACIPPYIKRQTGEVENPEVGGFALGQGLGGEYGYIKTTLEINRRDIIILTSDGIVEANNAKGDMLGFEALMDIIETGPSDSAEAMLEHIKHRTLSFIGQAEQHDDMTMMVIQV